MSEVFEGTESTETGESDPVDTPPQFQLDGRDILARVLMATLRKGMQGDPEGFDISSEIMKTLKEVSDHSYGPFEPSPWFCINFETNQVGRAYPYKGEHRIAPITPDFGMLQDIDKVVFSDESENV